jgi:hypothetical protein
MRRGYVWSGKGGRLEPPEIAAHRARYALRMVGASDAGL